MDVAAEQPVVAVAGRAGALAATGRRRGAVRLRARAHVGRLGRQQHRGLGCCRVRGSVHGVLRAQDARPAVPPRLVRRPPPVLASNQKPRGSAVSKVRFQIAISLDGYTAGPNQSEENPLGEGGMQLHEWAFELEAWRKPHGREGGVTNPSSAVVEEAFENVGAIIMGRNMFGGGPGPWGDWDGWWGDDPPFHVPVFVVTHHPREPLEKDGDTTFHFVTDGIEAALEQARDVAGDG